MKIWEEEEFLNIRNFIIFFFFFILYSELIILLLVNFILEKSSTYCTNVHSYFEKGNKYYISLHINLNVLSKFMIIYWATLISVLGHMRSAGHRLDSPALTDTYKIINHVQKIDLLKYIIAEFLNTKEN